MIMNIRKYQLISTQHHFCHGKSGAGFTHHHFCYVYILRSLKFYGEIYIGSAYDLKRRLREHNVGKELSTKIYLPWSVYYYEAYPSEHLARMREKRLKQNGNAVRELKKRIGLIV